MNKTLKKTLNSIFNVITTILIVILFFGIISNFQTNILGKKYNSFFGYTLFEIKTASMSGFTEIGDWILVKETTDVGLNDVITYDDSGSFVTHRIIQVYNDSFITKGDSNNSDDNTIYRDQIVGKVVKVLPKFGFIKRTLLNTKVIALLLIVIVIGSSLFSKEKNDSSLSSKIQNFFPSRKDNQTESLKKKIVYVDINDSNKDIENDLSEDKNIDIFEEYPILKDIEEVDDLSKTFVLSKITVKKSNTIREMKNLINENLTNGNFDSSPSNNEIISIDDSMDDKSSESDKDSYVF